MFDKIIFYNSFGAGDIYESREFVKEWMKLIPDKKYYYAHRKNPKIIRDITEIESIEVTPTMDSMRESFELDNCLYVNTWIGRDGQYVLPGIGCTVGQTFRMHNYIIRQFGVELSQNIREYIPKIDYTFYPDTSKVDLFFKESTYLENVFIDNGLCQSMQAENFPFDGIITQLATKKADYLFIVTHDIPDSPTNVISSSDIIKSSDGFDLTEIAYLSRYCKYLVGRNSGPHVHTQNYENCHDSSKRLVSITHEFSGSSFVVNTRIDMKKIWLPYTGTETLLKELEEIIYE